MFLSTTTTRHKPYSIFDVAIPTQGIREFNVSTSSRKQYSPFPLDVSDYIVSFYLRESSLVFDRIYSFSPCDLQAIILISVVVVPNLIYIKLAILFQKKDRL